MVTQDALPRDPASSGQWEEGPIVTGQPPPGPPHNSGTRARGAKTGLNNSLTKECAAIARTVWE